MALLDFRNRRPRSEAESGHLVLLVMMAVTVGAIMLTAAVQQWSTVERREREAELVFRGNQYVKAIKLYQLEHGGALPTSLEQLYEPGPRRLRYIRKLFRDPMAPDGKWGILLADPSGRGYINPNAPPAEQGVEGLEDLGKGFHFTSSLDSKSKSTPQRGYNRSKSLGAEPGTAFPSQSGPNGAEGESSVTAPGQPPGPIVGVISLYDQGSFRLLKEKDNYAEWGFHIFDVPGSENKQQPQTGVPTPHAFGVGPGGSQTIMGGTSCIGKDCPKGK